MNTAVESSKPKKKRNKRATAPIDSCVRTDLLRLAPNTGKSQALENLFTHYRNASVEIAEILWQAALAGEKVEGWRIVSPSNPFHASSVLMQPAIAQAKGALASHLGWLQKDVGKLISKLQRRLSFACRGLPEMERDARQENRAHFIHELRAINAKQAWRWSGEALKEPSMKMGSKISPASPRAYQSASFLFGLAAKHRNPPDAAACQVELTRGGAKMHSDRIDIPAGVLKELGLSLEVAEKASFSHPYWLRVAVGDSQLDPLAKSATSILIPARPHAGFALRNSGRATRGLGATGPKGFPVHPVAPCDSQAQPGKARGKAKAFKSNRMNPAKIRPEAIESIMLVRSLEPGGAISYQAGIRTQMAESFKATYAPLVDQVGIDFGIINFATLSMPMHGRRRHGAGFLQNEVQPVLSRAIRIESARQAQKEALISKSAKQIALDKIAASGEPAPAFPSVGEQLSREALREAESVHEKFKISTKRSTKFRAQAKGMAQSFIGRLFNDIAAILRPKAIVVERLDFRGGGLPPELNGLLAHSGRLFFEQKLKDLHEKFGIEIIRVESAYTSQECFECGRIEAANRKGDGFHCLACGHQAHADENASDTIGGRRPLPGSHRLDKTREGFSWAAQGSLPWLPWSEHSRLSSLGIRFPRLWSALAARPRRKKNQAIRPAASSAAHAPSGA